MSYIGDFRALFFPYCLERQEDGHYAILNRNYKPVGFATQETVTYADYPVLVKLKITKAMAKKLSDKGNDGVEKIYLYKDRTNPVRSKANMSSYLAKLALLAKLTVVLK